MLFHSIKIKKALSLVPIKILVQLRETVVKERWEAIRHLRKKSYRNFSILILLITKSMIQLTNNFKEKNISDLVLNRPDLQDFLHCRLKYLLLLPIFTFLDPTVKYFKWTLRIFKIQRYLIIYKNMNKLYQMKW